MLQINVDYAVTGYASWSATLSVDGQPRATLDRSGSLPKLFTEVSAKLDGIADGIGLCRTSHTLYGDARAFSELARAHGLRPPCARRRGPVPHEA